MEKFKNYGDVNFFDGGCIIREISNSEFEVIKCDINYGEENSYFLTHDTVDITDLWFNKEKIEAYAGIATDNAMYASDVVSYYGTQDCRGVMQFSKNDIIGYMQDRYASCDFENTVFFINSFDDSQKNVVAEITYNNGSVFRFTRDTLEDVIDYFTDYRLEAGDTLKIIEI